LYVGCFKERTIMDEEITELTEEVSEEEIQEATAEIVESTSPEPKKPNVDAEKISSVAEGVGAAAANVVSGIGEAAGKAAVAAQAGAAKAVEAAGVAKEKFEESDIAAKLGEATAPIREGVQNVLDKTEIDEKIAGVVSNASTAVGAAIEGFAKGFKGDAEGIEAAEEKESTDGEAEENNEVIIEEEPVQKDEQQQA
jgi:hypothetical protein